MTETKVVLPQYDDDNSQTVASRLSSLLERSGIPILLVLTIIYFGFVASTSKLFLSPANIQNILANQSVAGLIALGMVIPLISGYFDISIPAIAGLANVTMAGLIVRQGLPVVWAIVAAMVIALIAGAINGWLITGLRLDPFITTLGTYVLINGLLQAYTQGQVITSAALSGLGEWGSGKWLGVARPFWLLMVVAVITWYLLMQTPFGRKLAAIGSNEVAAGLAGIRVKRDVFISYVLGSLLAGIAGVVLTMRSSGADATTASAFLFPALAAVFLGQTCINPGHSNVWGTMFGVFFVATAVNGLILAGAENWITQVFNGAALVVSVMLSTIIKRVRERGARNTQLQAVRGGGKE
jgi:ribose transport system permease protein